jgi:hypothetical protein
MLGIVEPPYQADCAPRLESFSEDVYGFNPVFWFQTILSEEAQIRIEKDAVLSPGTQQAEQPWAIDCCLDSPAYTGFCRLEYIIRPIYFFLDLNDSDGYGGIS